MAWIPDDASTSSTLTTSNDITTDDEDSLDRLDSESLYGPDVDSDLDLLNYNIIIENCNQHSDLNHYDSFHFKSILNHHRNGI